MREYEKEKRRKLTFGALGYVTPALSLGDAEQFGEHSVPVAGAETLRSKTDAGAALVAGTALFRRRTVEVVGAGGAAVLGLVGGTAAGALELLARGTADAVLLAVLHEAAVQRRTVGLAGSIAAEEGTRRVADLQRLTRWTDVRQGLGLAATRDRGTGWSGAGDVDQLAGLQSGAAYAATWVATLAAGTAALWLDLWN